MTGVFHNATASPALWALTTVFTLLVTVNVCGELAPVMVVTVIRSPPTLMSKGKSPAAVVQIGEDGVVVATLIWLMPRNATTQVATSVTACEAVSVRESLPAVCGPEL